MAATYCMNDSNFGVDDCITYILGDVKRPAWLRNAKDEKAARVAARKEHGCVVAAWAHHLKKHGFKKLGKGMMFQPGDILLGDTVRTKCDVAKVADNWMPYRRANHGLEPVSFVKLKAVWRPPS